MINNNIRFPHFIELSSSSAASQGISENDEAELCQAARIGNVDAVKNLLAKVDPQTSGQFSEASLCAAVSHNHPKVVKVLLASGKVLRNPPNQVGDTPLCIAGQLNNPEIICLLQQEIYRKGLPLPELMTLMRENTSRFSKIPQDLQGMIMDFCENKIKNRLMFDAFKILNAANKPRLFNPDLMRDMVSMSDFDAPDSGVLLARVDDDCVLHKAIIINEIEAVKLLLMAGVDFDAHSNYKKFELIHEEFNTIDAYYGRRPPNWRAPRPGETVPSHPPTTLPREHLMALSCEYSGIYDGLTPLQWAVKYDRVDIIKLLFDAGADLNKTDEEEHLTALGLAYSRLRYGFDWDAYYDTAELLLKMGADISPPPLAFGTYNGPLHRHMPIDNQIDIIKKINIDLRNEHGETYLMRCANQSFNMACRELVKNGADVNAVDQKGWSALFHLYLDIDNNDLDGRDEIAQFLIEHGAKINAVDENGNSIMHHLFLEDWSHVRDKKYINSIELLINFGLKLDINNSEDKTPLDLAREERDRLATLHGRAQFSKKLEKAISLLEASVSTTPKRNTEAAENKENEAKRVRKSENLE